MIYIILCYLLFFYLLQLAQIVFFKFNKEVKGRSRDVYPKVSVLVAARNEENNILACLSSIAALDYPTDKLEVLIGNDQSEDSTAELVKDFISDKPSFKLIDIHETVGEAKGKSNVLAQLIKQSSGEYFFVTDADIEVPSSWIREMFEGCSGKYGIVGGITLIKAEDSFSTFQCMDLASAYGSIKVISDSVYPVTAAGNNMLVSAEAYASTGGYEKMKFSVTEDFQLVREVVKNNWPFTFKISSGILAFSKPVSNFSELLEQRKRWMKGAMSLPFFLVFVLVMQALAFPVFLFLIIVSPVLGILLWLIKIFLHRYFISLVLKRANYRLSRMKYFFSYDLYSSVFSFVLLFYYFLSGNIKWKGRTF